MFSYERITEKNVKPGNNKLSICSKISIFLLVTTILLVAVYGGLKAYKSNKLGLNDISVINTSNNEGKMNKKINLQGDVYYETTTVGITPTSGDVVAIKSFTGRYYCLESTSDTTVVANGIFEGDECAWTVTVKSHGTETYYQFQNIQNNYYLTSSGGNADTASWVNQYGYFTLTTETSSYDKGSTYQLSYVELKNYYGDCPRVTNCGSNTISFTDYYCDVDSSYVRFETF